MKLYRNKIDLKLFQWVKPYDDYSGYFIEVDIMGNERNPEIMTEYKMVKLDYASLEEV